MNIVHGFKISFVLTIIILSSGDQSQAKSHFDSLAPSVKEDLYLIKQLANNPSLFNGKYLDCYLGPRTSVITASFSSMLRSSAPVFKTFWHDRTGHIARYELAYSQAGINKYLAAFQLVLPQQDDLLIDDMDKILGLGSKRAFDDEGHLTQMYLVEPTSNNQGSVNESTPPQNRKCGLTKVFVYQDTHVVNIARVLVQYSGDHPSPPSATDMEEATAFRRENAFENHSLGHHDQAQRLLQSHIQSHPGDVEAHLKLAESYKAKSCLNEAISEYRTALSRCGDNSDLRQQCIAGLHSLKVEVSAPPLSGRESSQTTVLPAVINSRLRINVPPPNAPSVSSPLKNLEVGF